MPRTDGSGWGGDGVAREELDEGLGEELEIVSKTGSEDGPSVMSTPGVRQEVMIWGRNCYRVTSIILRNPLMLRDTRKSSGRAKTRQPGRELIMLRSYLIFIKP
jgi:hypothetical protein